MVSALEDYRVLDFGTAWAGPQVGAILADLGMEVIKIETHTRLDGMRMGRPIVSPEIAGSDESKWPDMQVMFHAVNRNKLSFTINLKKPGSRNIISRLIKISDIIIDNSSPGAMERLGLDHKSLEAIKPDIISVSLTGCGESGTLRDVLVYAPLITSLSGLQSLTGYNDEDVPLNIMSAYGDFNASIHAVFAVLAALWQREKTGEGQHVELAESWAVTSLLGEAIMEHSMNNRDMKPQGNRHKNMCPHNVYKCRGEDKWVAIAVSTEYEWQSLCKAMGEPGLAGEPRFGDMQSRLKNQEELDKRITAWTINYSPYEAMGILQRAGVAATPVMNIEDQYTDPHYQARQTFVQVQNPLVGNEIMCANPLRLSRASTGIRRPAPSLGEHNDYTLRELLGISNEEIACLKEERVIY